KFAEVNELYTSIADCKTANDTIFSDLEKMLFYEIKHSPEKQQENFDKLSALYKSYDTRFPQNDKNLSVKKALLLHDQKAATPSEIYSVLDAAFKNSSATHSDPKALYLYFDLYFTQYKNGLV